MNYGIILGQREEDWIAGTIPHEERNPLGDWRPYLPPGEWQANHQVDTMACVTFSALNCLETQMKFYNVTMNLSDRFTAKMSNTTPQGNYLYRVADSIRKDGVLPEHHWPAPQQFSWDSYYADIPQSVKDLSQKIDVRYEFVSDHSKESLKHQLKHAPLQVVIPGHAVMLFLCDNDVDRYFDSYEPYKKTWTDPYQAVLKLVYYPNPSTTPMTEKDVRQLQALEGYKDPLGVAYWTGKKLSDYLAARLPHKKEEIESALN